LALMRPRAAVLAAALTAALAAAVPLGAIESASPRMDRERATSSPTAVSLKPIFLFSMRGRPDPFMAYALLTNAAPSATAFDISDLELSGTIEVGDETAALFKVSDGTAYTLKGGVLYDPEDQAVPGVHGRIVDTDSESEIVLTQGVNKIDFPFQRSSKRLAGDGQP
jgi:hypothetical protein